MLESILADFEKHLGLKSSKGTASFEGYYLLKISDQEEVWLKDLDPGVMLRSILTSFSILTNMEEFYIYLMKANFLGQGTGGGVISLDPNEKFLTLSLKIPYEVNYKQVRDYFEDFLNYVSFLRGEIHQFEANAGQH